MCHNSLLCIKYRGKVGHQKIYFRIILTAKNSSRIIFKGELNKIRNLNSGAKGKFTVKIHKSNNGYIDICFSKYKLTLWFFTLSSVLNLLGIVHSQKFIFTFFESSLFKVDASPWPSIEEYIMKPTAVADEMFPEGAGTYVDAEEGGGSVGLLMDLSAVNEKAVHDGFFNDFEDLFDDEDIV